MKRILCLLLTASLLCALLIIPVSVSAAADGTASFEKSASAPKADVTFAASGTDGSLSLSAGDYAASQFVLKGSALRVTVCVTGTGSVSVGLFAFDTDAETSLLGQPIAENTFDGISGKAYLSLCFPSDAPLDAGEYVLAVWDAAGVKLVTRGTHESQLLYKNGAKESKSALITAAYAKKPSPLYGKPTAPNADGGYDPAPHMASAIRFDAADKLPLISSTNTCACEYMEEDGEGFARLKPSKDADDPFVWFDLPGTGPKTSEYKYLLIKCRIDEGCPTRGQIFVVTDENSSQVPWANTFFNYKSDTDWQYVIVKLEGVGLYTGLVTSLRLDPVDHMSGSHTIDIAYLAFFGTKEAAADFTDNFGDYEEETRPAPVETEPDYSTYTSEIEPQAAGSGRLQENGALPYAYKTYTHTIDFSDTPDNYHAGTEFGFYGIDNAVIVDGQLHNRPFTSTAFFTRQMLGDEYGIMGGELSFDLLMTAGSVVVTAREIQMNDEARFSGLRFILFADGTVRIEDRDGRCEDLDPQLDFSTERRVTLRDTGDTVSLLVDGQTAASVDCAGLRDEQSPHLPGAGYATVTLDRVRGYVDNASYTTTDVVRAGGTSVPVDYSSWIATDDLGRTTPTSVTVGTENGPRYVGLFYFMCHQHLSGRKANDVTALYLEGGAEAVTRTLSGWAGRDGAYWAEPYFGYYSTNDEWIYRKHAAMLDAAGVDFIFLDLSNGAFYEDQLTILFDTWLAVRREGGHTPQIAFMFGDMPSVFVSGVYALRAYLENPAYQELFFRWEDKPLILGNDDGTKAVNGRYKTWTVSGTTPQSKDQYEAFLKDNPAIKAFVDNEINAFLENYTVRKCWAWQTDEKRKGYWDWLQDSPQAPGRDFDGNIEQMAVCMGTHAHTNKGRSLLNEDTSYNTLGEFGYTLGTARYGYHFAEQFEYALSQNVQVIMITGWNEWYAGVQSTSNQNQVCGGTQTPGFYMVDQMSPEYSRDGEPMRLRDGIGFGDNYYYQMVSYIRQFKGITAPETVNGGSIDIHAPDAAAQWAGILPVFTDTTGDCTYRNDLGWAGEYRYVNGTGRNDIMTAQVSQDADKVYFYVTTAHRLIVRDDEVWMNLFLNVDGDTATGWEGYDLVLNRSRTDKTVSVERFVNGEWSFTSVGTADYVLTENGVMLAVDKAVIGGKAGETTSFTFKWADNADVKGDVMAFMELGDAAPNDRFAFNYTPAGMDDQRPAETEAETGADTEPGTADGTGVPETDTTAADGKGCKSAVLPGVMTVMLICCAAVLGKRRED
ncbi:MAG: hypothetical protein MJ192_02160 [Clostridia bacterium]|nr:hypothetical protein [Clostridia bacterium]